MTTRDEDDVMSSHLTVSALAEEHHRVGVELNEHTELTPATPAAWYSKSFTFSAQTYEIVRVCNSGSHQTRTDSNSYWWHTDDACVCHVITAPTVCVSVCFVDKAEMTNIMIIRRIMVEFIHRAKKPEIDAAHN